MTYNKPDREMGHANKALSFLIESDELKASYPPEKIRTALLNDCKRELEIFGPQFIDILRGNPKIALTEKEISELQEYVVSLPKWKEV